MKALILKLLPYLIGLLFVAGFVNRCNKAMKEAQDKKRVENALVISHAPLKVIIGKNGQQAAKTDVMQLTTPEIKKTYPSIISQAQNVYVKPGQIQNVSQDGTQTNQELKIKIKDSTIIKIKDSLRVDTIHVGIFHYSDSWTNISGRLQNDSLNLNYQSKDTITTFVHKGDRVHPWLWILSGRKLQQTVINSNPHTKIVFQRAIQIN